MNVRHILGISGGKDSAALFIGNPSVVFLLQAFFVLSLPKCCRPSRRHITVDYQRPFYNSIFFTSIEKYILPFRKDCVSLQI